MPVDSSIPLSFQPTQNLGPNIGQVADTANALLAFRVQQQKQQSQNALKQILSAPGALDATGNPTPETLQKVGSVDPNAMMNLRQNMLMSQQRELQTSVLKSTLFQKQADAEQDVRQQSLIAYEEAIKRGIPDPEARKIAQSAMDEGVAKLRQSGLFPEQKLANPMPFDPIRIRAHVQTYEEYIRQGNKERDERRADERAQRLNEAQKDRGVQVLTDPSNLDEKGNPTPYRIQVGTGKVMRLDSDEPYHPGGAAKVGTEARKPSEGSVAADRAAIAKDVEADPAFKGKSAGVRAAETERRFKEASAPPISDEAANLAADRVLAGDERATVGMARSNANITKVTNAIVERAKAKGLDGPDIARKVAEFNGSMAAERTLGTRTANMEVAANEVKNMAPLALSASKAVDRTKYPTLNAILIAAERGTGDENVVRFGLAANSLIYTYAKFLNPTGIPTDADKARATDILSTAWTKRQFAAAIDQIQKEIQSGRAAVHETRTEVGEALTGKGAVVEPPTPATPAGSTPPPASAPPASDTPPKSFPDAKKAPDGNWYVKRTEGGKTVYYRVD